MKNKQKVELVASMFLFAFSANARDNRYQLGLGRKTAIDECQLSVEYRFSYYGDNARTKPRHDIKGLDFGFNQLLIFLGFIFEVAGGYVVSLW